MSIKLTQNKEQLIELLLSTQRDGVDNLIADFKKMRVFTAPTSTSLHLNVEGVLVN